MGNTRFVVRTLANPAGAKKSWDGPQGPKGVMVRSGSGTKPLICIKKYKFQKDVFINIFVSSQQYAMEPNRLYWDSLAENYCDRVISPFHNRETAESFYRAVKGLHTGFRPAGERGPKDYTVLDIGCGKGLFFEILQRGWGDFPSDRHLTGIDFSPEMIRYAKEKQTGGLLVRGDMTWLPFQSSGFDEVYSINAFVVPERASRLKCFAESFRVLKPGGLFTGLFPSNENHLEQAYAMKEGYLEEHRDTDEDEALHAVYHELTLRGYDPVGGFIDAKNGAMRQKLFAKYELEDLLQTAGFILQKIVPFYYPVAVIKRFDLTVRKNILYDWLLIATKA